MMKTQLKTRVALCAAIALSPFYFSHADDDDGGGEDKDKKKEEQSGAEKTSETTGSVTVGGKKIDYTATAGTIQLKDKKDEARASVFYIAYTRDGVSDLSKRPVMFCFNGGPGSSSVWLHLGAFGPKRVHMGADGIEAPAPPYKLVENEYSVLGDTDLVFIDPVSTGYSRAEKGQDAGQFHGFSEDIDSVADFIRLYVTRHGRWESPKFLAGESYGAIRASGLSNTLQSRYGMYLNGVVLVSGLLDFRSLSPADGSDLPYVTFFPAMTATAHFHGKVKGDLKELVAEAEAFALGPYTSALAKGLSLPEEELKAVAATAAKLTGIDAGNYEKTNLRLGSTVFRKLLLQETSTVTGRFDGRVTSKDPVPFGVYPEDDPSYSKIYGAYASTMNHYVRQDLKFESDLPYDILSGNVRPWSYKQFTNRYVSVSNDLERALRSNEHLQFFVACGYHDLATPHLAIRYSIDHLEIHPDLRKNFRTEFYDGGHMMYTNLPSLKKLQLDLAKFFKDSDGVE
ncbi:MAG: carboxypeptidase C (cathepsin A) [Pseudoalteromonas tetraodonis]|jgi:carboxypeptidase C (cathepsin A)